MKSVVLVSTKFYAETEMLAEITKIKGVQEAFIVFGVYDIVVKAEAENNDGLRQIRDNIRNLSDDVHTLMLVVVGEETK